MSNKASTDGPESAIPTLRVMRLQSPDLYQPSAGSLESRCLLGTAMCLPDSLGVVYVGETFTAYLGVLNVSKDLPVRRLTVTAQLQTPSQRWRIPSNLDAGNATGGVDVAPESGIDTIISHPLEEAGNHILRVEVGYTTTTSDVGGGGADAVTTPVTQQTKTFRKFYRFQVTDPLTIRELTIRAGDASCFVSISVEYNSSNPSSSLTIARAEFHPVEGLVAERIQTDTTTTDKNRKKKNQLTDGDGDCTKGEDDKDDDDEGHRYQPTAMELMDNCGRLQAGQRRRYLFMVKAASLSAAQRGIAAGDEIGKAIFTWSKTMGETGRIASSPIHCPEAKPNLDPNNPIGTMTGNVTTVGKDSKSGSKTPRNNHFVVNGSGLSVDVATFTARRAASGTNLHHNMSLPTIDQILPVTVEPINPPRRMVIGIPQEVQFLIVNHSNKAMNLQLQLRGFNDCYSRQLNRIDDLISEQSQQYPINTNATLVVCGHSCKTLGELGPAGGSTVVGVNFTALATGLLRAQGCCIVDLSTEREIPQPPLFSVFVVEEEKQ